MPAGWALHLALCRTLRYSRCMENPQEISVHKDPVPVRLARLEAVCADPNTPDVIFMRITEGETLREIARAWNVPVGRLLLWIMDDEERYALYKRALEVQAHERVSEAVDIADNALPTTEGISHAKLRVDTRFKVAKHHAPAMYGDKSQGGGNRVVVVVNRGDESIKTIDGESDECQRLSIDAGPEGAASEP